MTDKIGLSCRACLINQHNFTYFIDANLEDVYYNCTSVKISQASNITKALCNKCYEKLQSFYSFKLLCIESNKKLLCGWPSDESNTKCFEWELKLESENEVSADNEYLVPIESEVDDGDNIPCLQHPIKLLKNPRRTKKKCYEPYSFVCTLCKRKFRNPSKYEDHLLIHDGKNAEDISCKTCDKRFATKSGLRRHNDSFHKPVTLELLQCPECGKVSKTRHTLKMHRLRMHRHRVKVICDICGKNFSNAEILKAHLLTHDENRMRNYECSQCSNKYLTFGGLADHKRRCHDNQRYICHLCNSMFRTKYTLMSHCQVVHERRRDYKCDLCPKDFSTKQNLVIHLRTHSGEKPYACTFCPMRHISKKRQIDHQRTHTKEKPHKCPVCSQAFTQKGTLNRHMKIHYRVAPVNDSDKVQLTV